MFTSQVEFINPSLYWYVPPTTLRLILKGWGESWYWCTRVKASFSRWYVRTEIKNLLRWEMLPGEQSNPISSIYSFPVFPFLYFHLSPTVQSPMIICFLFYLTPACCCHKFAFSIPSSVTVYNLTPSNSIGIVCTHNIFGWLIDSPHKLCNWTGTSFNKIDSSAELGKTLHNTDCAALWTSKNQTVPNAVSGKHSHLNISDKLK